MRRVKIEQAVKAEEAFVAVGLDHSQDEPNTYTNVNSTAFCPYINHNRRGHMHRQYSTGMPEPNYRYHWWQEKSFTCVQYCKLQRDPEKDFEKCEKSFKSCPLYKEAEAQKKEG